MRQLVIKLYIWMYMQRVRRALDRSRPMPPPGYLELAVRRLAYGRERT